MDKSKSIVISANRELSQQVSDPAAMRTLLATSFKGFKSEQLVKQACLEAMIRGYKFQDIVNKKIYAIPFGSGYQLVQSISDVRGIAMRNNQIGKDRPEYEEKDGKIITCTVTVKRLLHGHVGEYSATVYFDEYNKGQDNWATKPHTMIAKVAEMHALRMAFPEELSEMYVEEEFEKGADAQNKEEIRAKTASVASETMKMGNHLKNSKKEDTEQKQAPHGDTDTHDEECELNNGGKTCTCIPVINVDDQ